MEKIQKIYNYLKNYLSVLLDNMQNNVAYSLIVISTILSILFCDKFTFFIFGIIVYILYLKKEKFEFEKRKFEIDSIDLRYINVDNPESISKILDNYIEDCFNRDVLFPRGLKKDEYINVRYLIKGEKVGKLNSFPIGFVPEKRNEIKYEKS